jgi:beta-phosphoglucomutase family hydrolase
VPTDQELREFTSSSPGGCLRLDGIGKTAAMVADHAGAVPDLPPRVRACLFDLDGVLTRTATVHEAAWREMFDEFLSARSAPSSRPFGHEDYERFLDGMPRDDGIRSFLASRSITVPEGEAGDSAGAPTVQGLGRRKNELFLRGVAVSGVEVFPDSIEFVRVARAAGLRTAVVSSSANAAQIMEAAGIAGLFDARIDGRTIEERHLAGKPAPDTFQAGAAAVGVEAGAAAVFEDALAGVEAGRAGGFGWVVGVDRVGHRQALLEHGADVVVDDLGELVRAP